MFRNFKGIFFSTGELQLNIKSLLFDKIIFDIDRIPCSCTSLNDHGETANRLKLLLAFTVGQSMKKNWNHSMHEDLCLCGFSSATHSENFYPYLLNGRGRWRKWQKPLLKSELALFPSSLLLFQVVQFVKCWWSFLELDSKGLFLCYEKYTISLSGVHAFHKTWN